MYVCMYVCMQCGLAGLLPDHQWSLLEDSMRSSTLHPLGVGRAGRAAHRLRAVPHWVFIIISYVWDMLPDHTFASRLWALTRYGLDVMFIYDLENVLCPS